jgi:hypothetical protein
MTSFAFQSLHVIYGNDLCFNRYILYSFISMIVCVFEDIYYV